MSKIQEKFEELHSKNEKALIAYLMVGFPNEKSTLSAINGLVKGGVDIIELGFPFSDPIADGPVIQKASTTSLNQGLTIGKFFKIIKKIRKKTEIPLVIMTYSNILFSYGYDKFMRVAKKNGIDGIILPDMSFEESKNYFNAAYKNKLDRIFLMSPNTNDSRIRKILSVTSGFLYLVSIYGTTGRQTKIQQYTINAIKKAKKIVKRKVPIGIGFGVNTPKDVKKFSSLGVDGVIVGSAFLRLIEKTPANKIESKVASFTKSMKRETIIK